MSKEKSVLHFKQRNRKNNFPQVKPDNGMKGSTGRSGDDAAFILSVLGNYALGKLMEKKSSIVPGTGKPGHTLEKEADRTADRIIATRETDPGLPNSEFPLRSARADSQAASGSLTAKEPPFPLGNGQPLPAGERGYFEERFQTSFGNVLIHDNSSAAGLADMLNARAFTYGRNVVVGRGNRHDRRLMAHELAHVIQQGKPGNAPPSFRVQRLIKVKGHDQIDFDTLIDRACKGLVKGIKPGTMQIISAWDVGRKKLAGYWLQFMHENVLDYPYDSMDALLTDIIARMKEAGLEDFGIAKAYEKKVTKRAHDVPVIRQPNPWGCWAACFAMLYEWKNPGFLVRNEEGLLPEFSRPDTKLDPLKADEYIVSALGAINPRWLKRYKDGKGLDGELVTAFAGDAGLKTYGKPVTFTVIMDLLKKGPLMVGALSRGGSMHAQLLVGVESYGSPLSTILIIIDPLFGGEKYPVPFQPFLKNIEKGKKEFKGPPILYW